jgi:ribosomal protein S18 acetylase RimI-like enzyme
MDIRPNDPVDAGRIVELLNEAWAEARGLPRVVAWPVERPPLTGADILAARERTLDEFVIERDGKLVSCAAVAPIGEDKGVVAWFATHPQYRRQGLASQCLTQALNFLRDQGVAQVHFDSIVDSRVTSACGFLEAQGFEVRDPEHQNIVMQIDMDGYEITPIVLAEDYRIESLRPEWIPEYLAAKDRVFGGVSAPDWFEKTFSHRWDFEWDGWMTLWKGDTMIGMSGADLFRDPAHPDQYCGAQVEFVGVEEGHRGLQLGKMLVCSCLNYIKERDVQPCQLITQIFRTPAVTLYLRLGFRHVRENRTYQRSLSPS